MASDVSPPPRQALLRLAGVQVQRGTRRVLLDVDWTVHGGESWLVHGPNGGGKSTLLEAAAGLLPLGAGVVEHAAPAAPNLLLRRDAQENEHGQRPFGLCLQLDGVCGDETVGERLQDALTVAGTPADETTLVDLLATWGLDHRRHDATAWLSGGLRRRLAVLCALAVAQQADEPRLILLDEPTEGLDAASQVLLSASLRRLVAAGHALVLVSHDPRLSDLATHRAAVAGDGVLDLVTVADEAGAASEADPADEADAEAAPAALPALGPRSTTPAAGTPARPLRHAGRHARRRLWRLERRTAASLAPRAAAAAFLLLLLAAVDLEPLDGAAGQRLAAFLLLIPGLVAAFLAPASLAWDDEAGAGRWWRAMRGPGWSLDHAVHAGLGMAIVGVPLILLVPWMLQQPVPGDLSESLPWAVALWPAWILSAVLVARLHLWMVALARRQAVLTGVLAIAGLILPAVLLVDAGASFLAGEAWWPRWAGALTILVAMTASVDLLGRQ